MKPLSREERFQVVELVAELAGEAAKNTNVIWIIEFQEEFVERLYRRIVTLLEEPRGPQSAEAADAAGSVVPDADVPGAAAQQSERKGAKKGR